MLTRGAVERRVEAGAEVRALIAALAETADALPAGSYAFIIVPDRLGSIPFARNAQGGLMLPPVQPRSLSAQLVVQLAEELPSWPRLLEKNIVGRLKAEPLASVTADPQAPGTSSPPAVPDRYYCWSPRRHALVALPLAFAPGFRDWDDVVGTRARRCRVPRMIASNDLARHHAPLRAELDAAMARVHDRGWYILGPEVEAFEREFAAYCGAAECVAVGNGTDALELALRALGIGAGDEVATTANAGMYATTAIRAAGAEPAYVEIDASTLLMDPAALAAGLGRARARSSSRISTGASPTSTRSARIARERGIALIEDCAQAHGARAGGAHGRDPRRARLFQLLSDEESGRAGRRRRRRHRRPRAGGEAARAAHLRLGRQVPLHDGRRDEFADGRAAGGGAAREAAASRRLESPAARDRGALRARRSGIPPSCCRRRPSAEADVAHLYVVRTKERESLRAHLAAAGVATDVHYPVPDHRQPGAGGAPPQGLARTERACAEVLSLPCYPELTAAEIDAVAAACNRWQPATRS